MSNLTLQEVHQYLIDNKYILASKEKGYTLSKSYQQDVKKMKAGEHDVVPMKGYELAMTYPGVYVAPLPMAGPINQLGSVNSNVDWIEWFTRFIKDAQVPRTLEDNRGNAYPANKYSEDGMKAFRKAIEGGADYEMLKKSTMLYYKSNVRYKKAVGNYFAQGDWRTDYQNLSEAALGGTTELTNHIKQETQTNEHNPYRRG